MNIYDIAKLAGVSIATVSRVVNDSPRVSEKTKEKVRKVMEENNYTPNVFARGLGLNSMKSVGIVCPDVADSYMARAVSYLEKNLRNYGYDCILYCSGYDTENKQQTIQIILQKRIDALILVGSNYADEADFVCSVAEQLPVFLINGYIQGSNIYCVLTDDFQAIYDVTEELIFEGKRDILFLTTADSYSSFRKQEGFESALRDHGIEINEKLILKSEKLIHKSFSTTKDMLLRQRHLDFDSVIATEDMLAISALKYAKARGLKVPSEINIVGYNNSELANCCEPELTSVDNRVEVLCKTAIDSLMTVLGGDSVQPKQMIKSLLVKRNSTDF